jgi:choline dehydrogenase-like flavoprotein
LGGSSVLNFLVWDRAAEVEYDAWEQLGSTGWNWDNMYKYMKKAEDFTAPSTANAKKLDISPVASNYGSSGPIQVSYPKYVSKQVQKWIPALVSLGLTKNDEPLGGNNVGASVQPSDINPTNETRSSSVAAYFVPASSRKNLKVLVSALVSKVNLEKSSKLQKATGVTFTSGGTTYTAKACEKVILSGGTVNTPALLELSGIGNKTVLNDVGVTPVIELANVGENLQDHVYTSAAYELVSGTITLDTLRNNATFAAEQLALYKAGKTSIFDETVPGIGYLTLPQLVGASNATKLIADAVAYVKTQKSKPYYATLKKQLDYPQKDSSTVSQMEVIGIDGYFSGAAAPADNTSYVTFLAAQQHLLSRGTIHINSAKATVHPTIQPNYFEADFDLDVLTAGTEYLRKIAATSTYTKNFITKEYVPGNVDIREYSLTKFTTEYHPIGTASMLPQAKGGVVDAQLKVYGTSNLHVVDASIIPLHVVSS